MAHFYDASDVNWTPYGAEYFNRDRGMIDEHGLTLSGNFIDTPSLSGIQDYSLNHDTLFYITTKKFGRDIFTNQSTTSAYHLSSFPMSAESINLGTSGSSTFVDYYSCNSLPQYKKTVDINNKILNVPINYLMISPFKTSTRRYREDSENPFSNILNVFKFNIMNLKNIMTPFYEYDETVNTSPRTYNKIYSGTRQKFGYSNLFFGYTADTTQLKFKYNDTNYFHYPKDAIESPLSASSLANRGAKPGDSPMNSDIIAIDQEGYYKHTSSGSAGTTNGIFLCAWLSGSNDCSCGSVWKERWYDPNTVTQGDAYITSVNSGSCEHVWDVDSTMNLTPNTRYYFDRYGEDRNSVVVDSVSSNLIVNYSIWEQILKDQANSNDGYILNSYAGPSTYFDLDGTTHAHVPPTDSILQEREISVGVCAYKDNWCCGKNSQIIGNYHVGGWGIFYNTGMPNNILTVGDNRGSLYSFNVEGTRIFEKNIEADPDINNVSIDYIATDVNGARWILDSYNNKIFKVGIDDLLNEIINFPVSYDVNKLQIDSTNRIYLYDRTNRKVFVHDEDGLYDETFVAPSDKDLFELDADGNIVFSDGDLMAINTQGDVYKTWGSNLYKNGSIIFYFNDPVMDIKIDEIDNVWIVYNGNVVVKIDSDDNILFTRKIFSFLSTEKNARIGLTRKSTGSGCDETRVWIVFEDLRHLAELDSNGRIIDSVSAGEQIISRNCDDFTLRATGDFTGFDINRKFDTVDSEAISVNNPAITIRAKFSNTCGVKRFKSIHLPACNLLRGWHHFGFTYNANSGTFKMFVDGTNVQTVEVGAKVWKLDYNTTTPLIIGGNSGKLGSENIEKSIIENQYFVGRIDDVRLYDTEISPFTMKAISDYKLGEWEDLIWNVPITEKNYIEKAERFFMNKKPGYVSNRFNLKINGLDVSSDLKLLIEDVINNSIIKLIPAHTEINTIVWN